MNRFSNPFSLRAALLPVLVGALASCSHGSPERARVLGEACAVRELDRSRLGLAEGRDVYVEPQAVGLLDDGFFVAGQPTYEWGVDASGRATMASSRAFLGVEVRRSGVVVIPNPPMALHVGQVEAVRMDSDRLAFLIEEVDRPSIGEAEPIRVFYAEYVSGQWGRAEELPLPPGGRLAFPAGSSLVVKDDASLAWATPFVRERGGIDVLLYEHDADGWRWSFAARDWADEVGLSAVSEGRIELAIGGLDPEFGSQLASMRVQHRDTTWSTARRLDLGAAGDRFRAPRYLLSDAGLDLSWLRTGDGGTSEAWVVTGLGGPDERAPVRFDSKAVLAYAAGGAGSVPHVVTNHADPALGVQQLRVHRRDPTGYTLAGSMPYPFTGPFAALMTPSGELLVIGAEATPDPMTPSVRSLVIRLSLCT